MKIASHEKINNIRYDEQCIFKPMLNVLESNYSEFLRVGMRIYRVFQRENDMILMKMSHAFKISQSQLLVHVTAWLQQLLVVIILSELFVVIS